MDFEIGAILEGRVTGITKFGAFVALPGGRSGLVHISEIANAFVNDANDFLKVGDMVKVKILSVNEMGKINLSIKQAQPPAPHPAPHRAPAPRPNGGTPRPNPGPRDPQGQGQQRPYTPRPNNNYRNAPPRDGEVAGPTGDASFEDKLKHFMQQSDSKINDSKIYADRRNGGRRRK